MKARVFILLLLLPFFASAKDASKEYQKAIDKYDIVDVVDTLNCDNPTEFWRTIRDTNTAYQSALKDARKGKAKEAQRLIGDAVKQMRSVNEALPLANDLAWLADSLWSFSGIGPLYREATLAFTLSRDENAYSYPDGQIYITIGEYNRLNGDFDLLMAAYAHELAHFVLQHAFVQTHQSEKSRKKAELIGGIITSFCCGFLDGMYEAEGTPTYYSDLNDIKNELRDIKRNQTSYRFAYGRNQVFEADIIAYRFLQWAGIGGDAYVRMLQALGSELEIFQNSGDEHPLTADRIALIRQLESNDVYADRQFPAIKNANKPEAKDTAQN